MKRYYNSNVNDPIRESWRNNVSTPNSISNQLQDDIMINSLQNNNLQKFDSSSMFDFNKPLNYFKKPSYNQPVLESFSNDIKSQYNGNYNNVNYNNKVNKNLYVPPPLKNNVSNAPSYSLKSNTYYNMDEPEIELLPKKNNNTLVPSNIPHMNVTNYNSDKQRMNMISQELVQKDEELQKYKNEVYHLQLEVSSIKKEKNQMISTDVENKLLKEKLNEHYEISRELSSVKHQLQRVKIENKGNSETIEALKNIIHKQHIQITSNQVNRQDIKPQSHPSHKHSMPPKQRKIIEVSSSDEEINSSDEEYSDSETDTSSDTGSETESEFQKKIIPKVKKPVNKPPPTIKPPTHSGFSIQTKNIKNNNKKIIYENKILKNSLINQGFASNKIDKIMKIMKITNKTEITKELLNSFLDKLKMM